MPAALTRHALAALARRAARRRRTGEGGDDGIEQIGLLDRLGQPRGERLRLRVPSRRAHPADVSRITFGVLSRSSRAICCASLNPSMSGISASVSTR